MSEQTPIKELIDRWPTRRALADEIGAKEAAVHKWAKAGRIPAVWQAGVIRAARARGIEHVTAEWMVAHHEQERGAA